MVAYLKMCSRIKGHNKRFKLTPGGAIYPSVRLGKDMFVAL